MQLTKKIFFICLILSISAFSACTESPIKKEIPLESKIGQMLIIGFAGTDPREKNIKLLVNQIQKGEIGGVIFFSNNIKNKKQIKNLIKTLNDIPTPYPLFLAIDQEGGKVQRLSAENGFNNFPSPEQIAKSKNTKTAYKIYKTLSKMLREIGFNLNFGTVVDLKSKESSPIIAKQERSYSADPKKVVLYAEKMIDAHREEGVLTAVKHFPGYGSATTDTHRYITDVTYSWKPREITPYKKLIKKKKIDMIMTAHVFHEYIDPNYPASISKKHLKNILRNKLNYQGVIITDDLYMGGITNIFKLEETVISAINSGVDILLFANTYNNKNTPKTVKNIILKAIQNGNIQKKSINDSFARITKLKEKLAKHTF